jgi:hypothetical protein
VREEGALQGDHRAPGVECVRDLGGAADQDRGDHPVIIVDGASPPIRERAVTRSTDILERPDVRDSDTDKNDEVFHYVRKNKIAESAVMGTLVEALCGEVFPVTKAPKPGSPVCPKCQEIYEQLRKD